MEEILLKDVFNDPNNINELYKKLPFMVCYKTDNVDSYRSYHVIGIGKDEEGLPTILLGYDVYYDADDCSWGPTSRCAHSYKEISINNITDKFIFSHEATKKQKEFLDEYTKYDSDNICGYHAFKIIQETIDMWKHQKENKKRTEGWNADDFDYDPEDQPYIGINGW